MTDETSVNTQITDSVAQVHTATLDQSPVLSFAVLDLVMAETLGMGMHNAINTQHSMQITAAAAVTATCARMINTISENTISENTINENTTSENTTSENTINEIRSVEDSS